APRRGGRGRGAGRAVRRVRLLLERVVARRRGERGPAAAPVVLRVRPEQLRAAPGAAVRPRLERVVVLAAKRPLRSLLAQDAELLGAELLAPLRLCLRDLLHAQWSSRRPVSLPAFRAFGGHA